MAKNENIKIGINLSEITKFDIEDIEDQDMISKDFRKATFITILSIFSASILTTIFFLL